MRGISKGLAVGLLGAALTACGGSGGGGGGNGDDGCGPVVGDGNESFDTAGTITDTLDDSVNGEVVEGEATGADPFDIFKFTAPADGNYDITLNWDNATNDLDLEIYNLAVDPNFPIAESDEINTNVEQVNDVALTAGGMLHILVLAWDSNCTVQNYTLTVQQ